MPILGQGILPSGATGNELVAVTRRAFIPKLVVQLYKATPTLSALLAGAEPVAGGVSPITQPVQGSAMVTTQVTGYSGSFNAPLVQTGIQNAEFNLKAYVTPIPFYVMEGLAQVDAGVIPLIEARMNDAGNSIADTLSTDFWVANSGASSTLATWSIQDIISTSNPARGNFGGIDRTVAANAFWKGTVINDNAVSTSISRQSVLSDITQIAKLSGGEMPTFGITDMWSWSQLARDFVGQERYLITPQGAYGAPSGKEVNAAFTALSVAGVPIYSDPYAPTPSATSTSGQVLYLNTNYLGYKIHSDAAFAVAGPESLLPNYQLGYIMVLVCLLELFCAKPAAQGKAIGYQAGISSVF
jgi:hypothetical protein